MKKTGKPYWTNTKFYTGVWIPKKANALYVNGNLIEPKQKDGKGFYDIVLVRKDAGHSVGLLVPYQQIKPCLTKGEKL